MLLINFIHNILGVFGVIWTIFWFSLTFEKPAFHPTISLDEKNYIEEQIGHVSQTHPTVLFFRLNIKKILF